MWTLDAPPLLTRDRPGQAGIAQVLDTGRVTSATGAVAVVFVLAGAGLFVAFRRRRIRSTA